MSLMPRVWYSIKMSGLHNSSFCVEHDDASAMYANIILAIFVLFLCCDRHTLAGWTGADRGGPASQSGFGQEPCGNHSKTSLSHSLAVFCHNPSYVTASRCARSFRYALPFFLSSVLHALTWSEIFFSFLFLLLILHHLSRTVSLAKLDHQIRLYLSNHLYNLTFSRYSIDCLSWGDPVRRTGR